MKKNTLLIILFWFLIICVFVFSQESIVLIGQDVVLQTKPIDPKDILRGDYVNLSFNISTFNHDKNPINYKKTLYVVLEPDENNIAQIKRVQYEKPKDELFIKGKYGGWSIFGNRQIKYGIESWFVKSKEAKRLERELTKGGYARVKVDKFGRAKIISISNRM